ncbi:beta-ketoacyl synthase N-terminal-like domain-containing protein, partial [Saccharopolyspora sp. NPDC003752]
MGDVETEQREGRRLADEPVAVVGIACLFPQARNKQEFWTNVVRGRDCMEDVPESHWRIEDYYDPDPTAEDKTYCRRGGFVPQVDFDPMEFGIPPNILGVTDILQLLSLGVARDVLADAGCPDASWYDPSRTGVTLGVTGANSLTQPLATRLQAPVLREVVQSCGLSDAAADEVVERFRKAFAPWEENSFPGMLGNVVAGRIANRFDLGGTNCTFDAACASSLAAVRYGVAELVDRRADMMLVGGCDAENTILMYMCFSKTPALSRSEQIRPFDRNADGTMIGEGIGMLALKRLADAERDGDRIYSVITGIGSSSDGRFKSIYAPRESGQIRALRRAYDDAGCTPADIGLVEAHGTGTPAGDETELGALKSLYAEHDCPPHSVAIGSVKSQIGHTKAAAGAAGLIKMSLALHHQVLPPTINVEAPAAPLADSRSIFYPNTSARPWLPPSPESRRRGAVSSFGFGGTNFHCVVEEAPTAAAGRAGHSASGVALWHAPDLETLVAAVTDQPPADGGPVPADHARLVLVHGADDLAERRELACELLRSANGRDVLDHPKGIHYRRRALAGVETLAVAFAGQGSQHVDMGRAASLVVPHISAAFAEIDAIDASGEPVGLVTYPPPANTGEARAEQEQMLRRTDYAQPAIGALSAGYYDFLCELGLTPTAFVGHSFGELTALWAAGALNRKDYFRAARARGAAMAACGADGSDPGTMLSVDAGSATVRSLLEGHSDVNVCNVNSPAQTVVGGGTKAVEDFALRCKAAGLKTYALPVAAAFHTSYVEPARAEFARTLNGVQVGAASRVYCNTHGASYIEDADANAQTLVRQIVEPVEFADQIAAMYADGVRVFVEIGPKKILASLVSANLPEEHDEVLVVSTDAGRPDTSDQDLMGAVAQLLTAGVPLERVNRYLPPVMEKREPKFAIPLRGVNYVPDERRQAYANALAAPSPAIEETSAATSNRDHTDAAGNPSTAMASAETVRLVEGAKQIAESVEKQTMVHQELLQVQEKVAERLAEITQQASAGGMLSADVAAALVAVGDQVAAITRAHERAGEAQLRFLTDAQGGEPVLPTIRPDMPALSAPSTLAESTADKQAASNGSTGKSVVTVPPDGAATKLDAAFVVETAVDEGAVASAESVLLEVVADKTGYP